MSSFILNRRRLLTAAGSMALMPALGRITPAFAADMTVGFLYVGPRDDFGYNQAHAEGAAAVKDIAA